ncbi:MAG: DMT family transporter [Candidatus Thorarchaeota archaeon]
MAEDYSKYYILLIIATFTWGGSWVAAKILVDIAPPFTIGFFRFLIGSVLFLGLLGVTGSSPRYLFTRARVKWLFFLGLTGIFGYGVMFLIGMQFTTAAQGSIIAGFNPITISIFAHIIHKEHLNRNWKYIGFGLGFLGVVFVVGVQSLLAFQLEYLIGNFIILGAMCLWGLYSSIAKEAMKTMTPLEANAGAAVIGMTLFGIGAIFEEPWTLTIYNDVNFWWNVTFLGVFTTFVGFLLFFISIEKLGATRTGGFINFVPVFGTTLSVLILAETIYWTFLVGLILVVAGVSIINYPTIDGSTESIEGHKEEDMHKG